MTHISPTQPDFTGWLLPEARDWLAANTPATAVQVVETAPPARRAFTDRPGRKARPGRAPRPEVCYGEWRVLRAEIQNDENGACCRLRVAREQVPDTASAAEADPATPAVIS